MTFDAKIQHAHNMGMYEAGDGLRLAAKVLDIIVSEPCVEQFDGGLRFKVNMLAKIHFGKPSLPQLTDEPVIAQALPNIIYLICHARPLLMNFFSAGLSVEEEEGICQKSSSYVLCVSRFVNDCQATARVAHYPSTEEKAHQHPQGRGWTRMWGWDACVARALVI